MLPRVLSSLPARAALPRVLSASFASESTKPYVLVNKHTKVICQGFTGTQVREKTTIEEKKIFLFQTHNYQKKINTVSSLFRSKGYLPQQASYRIWNKDGWWRFSRKGRNHSSRFTCLQQCERGSLFSFLSFFLFLFRRSFRVMFV